MSSKNELSGQHPSPAFLNQAREYLGRWAFRLGPYIATIPRLSDGVSFTESFPVPSSLDPHDEVGRRGYEYSLTISGHESKGVGNNLLDRHVHLHASHNRGTLIRTDTGLDLMGAQVGIAQRTRFTGDGTVDRLDVGYYVKSEDPTSDVEKRFAIIFDENDHGSRLEDPGLPLDEPEVIQVFGVLDKIINFIGPSLPK